MGPWVGDHYHNLLFSPLGLILWQWDKPNVFLGLIWSTLITFLVYLGYNLDISSNLTSFVMMYYDCFLRWCSFIVENVTEKMGRNLVLALTKTNLLLGVVMFYGGRLNRDIVSWILSACFTGLSRLSREKVMWFKSLTLPLRGGWLVVMTQN